MNKEMMSKESVSDEMLLDVHATVARRTFDVDLNFTLAQGQVLSVMGPSGSGKSTLLAALAGTLALDRGRIRLGGKLLADAAQRQHVPPHQRSIGLLGQDPLLFPHLSVQDNIAFAARLHHPGAELARAEALTWLERLELTELAAQRPAALSGGQCQRVALARALAAHPQLLLLDEPFSSLDVEAAYDMRMLVREQLTESGTTAIIVSHDATDASTLADRLVMIDQGRIVQQGTVDGVLADPQNRFAGAVAASARWVCSNEQEHKDERAR